MHSSLESNVSLVAEIGETLDAIDTAPDDRAMESATRRLVALARDLSERLAMLAPALRVTTLGDERHEMVRRIRRIID